MPPSARPASLLRRLTRRFWRLAALPAVAACDATSPGSRDPDARDLPIAFHAESGDGIRGEDIYLRGADADAVRALVERDGSDFAPAWSPDGRRIAFTGRTGTHVTGALQIFVVDADGTGLRALTPTTYRSDHPAWSPDGTRIAFSRWVDPFTFGLAIMNADGSNVVQVPNASGAMLGASAWAPDGSRLAFSGSAGDYYGIWVVRSDGSGRTELTPGTCSAGTPAWSPDGSQIAFNCGVYERFGGLHVMNGDGSNFRQITFRMGDGEPTWSPDGRRILFTRWRHLTQPVDPTTDLFVVDVATGVITPLGETSLNEKSPAWQPPRP